MKSHFRPITLSLLAISLFTTACDGGTPEEPEATFRGYWMESHQLETFRQAMTENSCSPILEHKGLHPTDETITMSIMSIWNRGIIYALDTVIQTGATTAKSHPHSVTAANIPGRFVEQGQLFLIEESDPLQGSLVTKPVDQFSLALFEVKDLEDQIVMFTLNQEDLLTFTMQTVEEIKKKSEPYELTYTRISFKDSIDMVDFAQNCLDN